MYKKQEKAEFVSQASIHDYKIIQTIEKGCSSKVFKVQEINNHDIYAMKIIPKKNNAIKISKIENEINKLSMLNHPNIIKIYDVFDIKNNQNEEFLVIITDFCENGNLIDYATKYGFKNDQEKKKITFQLLEAIRYLHKHGIVHRNINPENILLDKNLVPKLCNFNCNCYELSEANFFKEDIWSFGITLYETFELCFPFKNIEDAINDKITITKSFKDKKFKKLIFDCIKRNPEFRPTADQLLKEEYFVNVNKHTEKKNYHKTKRNNNAKKKMDKEQDFYF